MTELEKQQLVDAVITQLKNEGTDVSNAKIEEDVNGISYVICYNADGEIVRASTATLHSGILGEIEDIDLDTIRELADKVIENQNKITNEVARATEAEKTIDDKLNEEIERSVGADQGLLRSIDEEARRATEAEEEIKSRAVDADSLNVTQEIDGVRIDFDTLIDGALSRDITIPSATTEKAGVMSAGDKMKLTELGSEVVLLAGRVDYGVIAKKYINSALSNDWGNERYVLKNQSVNATDGEIITINNNTSTLLYCSLIFEDDSTSSVKTQAGSTIDIYSNNYELSITKITVYFLEIDSVEGEVDVLIHNRNSLTEQLSELKKDILGKNYTYTTNAINPSYSAIPTIKKGVKIVIELTEDGNNGNNILYVYGKTNSTDSSSITMAKFIKGSTVGDKIEYIAENDISYIKMTGGEDGNTKSINILYVGAIEGLEDDIQKNEEKINAINSELGSIKDKILLLLNSFDSTALKQGMYATTADSGVKPTFGNTSATHLNFICGSFECKEGWIVRLKTVGGTGTARAYCFTDSEKNVISRYGAVANCDVEMTAPKGTSYIYVNCDVSSSDVFSLDFFTDINDSIKDINRQIEELNQNSLTFPQIHTQTIRRRSKDEPIRIFLFGSSWHMNTWWYLNKLIKEAGINAYIEAWFSDGAYFSQWLSRYRGEPEQSNLRRYVSTNGSNWSVTMTENIGATDFRDSLQLANWDIIGFQQGAEKGIDWENYRDYWSDLVSMVRSNASNDTVIAYNATWAPPIYSTYLTEQSLKGQEYWMSQANGCFTKFLSLSGIVEVIPQGSMMWAVRSSSDLNDTDDLCKDSLHLKNGLPIYATGANWFESIIQPMFGTSINDISWLPTEETQSCPTSRGYFTPINTEQAVLIKKIIRLAASNRWGLPTV